MNIGFIGAGKVGFSLGRYLKENGVQITGYFSNSAESAKLAADFTKSRVYSSIEGLLNDSDTLFLTVPDGQIVKVWDYMKELNLNVKNKKICHCSGSMSSTAFFDAQKTGAYVYSIHPLLAINDKYNSWQDLSKAFFAIEGSEKYLLAMKELFTAMGNQVIVMDTAKKALYHASAVMVSNLVTALLQTGIDMLEMCNFTEKEAQSALLPLFMGNALNIARVGTVKSLTGPIERADINTVQKHLVAFESLESDKALSWEKIYVLLSQRLIELAESRGNDKDYSELKKILAEKLV